MKSKILLSTVLLALGFTHTVSAQELKEETGSKNYPHMFFDSWRCPNNLHQL